MYELPESVIILSAILSPMLAVITVIIIILQYRLAKYFWRLDLFEKRYSIYNSSIEFISKIVSNAKITNDELFSFLRNTRDRDFLFADDIKKYLNELYSRALELYSLENKLKSEPVGEQRNSDCDEESELLKWFSSQYDIARIKFGKYLSIKKK
jgi:hypothetical protein